MLSGSTASKPFSRHMAKRLAMIGSIVESLRMSSHFSPGQPLERPSTDFGKAE